MGKKGGTGMWWRVSGTAAGAFGWRTAVGLREEEVRGACARFGFRSGAGDAEDEEGAAAEDAIAAAAAMACRRAEGARAADGSRA